MDLERTSLASLKGMREVSVANQVILAINSTDTNNRRQITLTSSQNAQDDFPKKFENTKQVPKVMFLNDPRVGLSLPRFPSSSSASSPTSTEAVSITNGRMEHVTRRYHHSLQVHTAPKI